MVIHPLPDYNQPARSQISLKKYDNAAIWNAKAGRCIGRAIEVLEISSLIDLTKTALFNIYNDIQLSDANVTAEKVKNHFLGGATTRHNLLEQFQRNNNDVERLIGISKSKATFQKYEVTRKHLTNFIKERYNLTDISFREINHQFLLFYRGQNRSNKHLINHTFRIITKKVKYSTCYFIVIWILFKIIKPSLKIKFIC